VCFLFITWVFVGCWHCCICVLVFLDNVWKLCEVVVKVEGSQGCYVYSLLTNDLNLIWNSLLTDSGSTNNLVSLRIEKNNKPCTLESTMVVGRTSNCVK